MELLLASWLNPAQLGRLREAGRSISLDEVTDMATSSFRSMGTREDTMVLVLGLLNLGTVLCYAIYAQLFKPSVRHGSQSPLDDPQFLYKKVQNIMDELVLHMQTATYYKRVAEEPNNAVRSRRGHQTPSYNFFKSPDEDQDYQVYLKGKIKKMARDLVAVFPSEEVDAVVSGKRLTKRQAPPSPPNITRRRLRTNATMTLPAGRRDDSSTKWKTPPSSSSRRADHQPQAIGRAASSAETDGSAAADETSSSRGAQQPDVSQHVPVRSSAPRIPFPRSRDTVTTGKPTTVRQGDDEIRSGNRNKELGVDANVPRRQRQQHPHPQPAFVIAPSPTISIDQQHWPVTEELSFLGRLMKLIQQTAPISMDVLGVYDRIGRIDNSKCLERLLCQLNQDWKSQGAVPASLAPFLRFVKSFFFLIYCRPPLVPVPSYGRS